jgi:hypothetical protein
MTNMTQGLIIISVGLVVVMGILLVIVGAIEIVVLVDHYFSARAKAAREKEAAAVAEE